MYLVRLAGRNFACTLDTRASLVAHFCNCTCFTFLSVAAQITMLAQLELPLTGRRPLSLDQLTNSCRLASSGLYRGGPCRADQASHCGVQITTACVVDPNAKSQSRRQLLRSAAGLALVLSAQPSAAQAAAAGLTLEDVTPQIAASGPLGPRETAVINIFEAATPAVVTVFDTTLIVSVNSLMP
jgi:hypothetical protein